MINTECYVLKSKNICLKIYEITFCLLLKPYWFFVLQIILLHNKALNVVLNIWIEISLFLEQHQQQNGYEPQQNGYEEQAANVNGVHDQEVPIDDAAYEEVNGHVANGEDVVDRDIQNGMQNGVEVEPMQQEVRIWI